MAKRVPDDAKIRVRGSLADGNAIQVDLINFVDRALMLNPTKRRSTLLSRCVKSKGLGI